MRAYIADRGPRFQPAPEELMSLWQAFIEWRERWRGKMQAFEFFADGNGGFTIVDVADEQELQQMMLEYPFTQLDQMEVRVIVDGDTSLEQWRQALEAQAGS